MNQGTGNIQTFLSFLPSLFVFLGPYPWHRPYPYQAGGWIGATAASLCHNHSNARSEPHLQHTPQPQQCRILNPLSKAGDRTCVLMDTSLIRFHWTMVGTPQTFLSLSYIFFLYPMFIQELCKETLPLNGRSIEYHGFVPQCRQLFFSECNYVLIWQILIDIALTVLYL